MNFVAEYLKENCTFWGKTSIMRFWVPL